MDLGIVECVLPNWQLIQRGNVGNTIDRSEISQTENPSSDKLVAELLP